MSGALESFAAQIIHLDGSLTLRLSGELDVATAPVLRRVGADLVSPHLRAVTIDLAPLRFVDAAGLRALTSVVRASNDCGARTQLLNVTGFVWRVMHIIGAHELISAVTPPGVTDVA